MYVSPVPILRARASTITVHTWTYTLTHHTDEMCKTDQKNQHAKSFFFFFFLGAENKWNTYKASIETKQNKQEMIELSMDRNDFAMTKPDTPNLCTHTHARTVLQSKPNHCKRSMSCAFFDPFKTLVDIGVCI